MMRFTIPVLALLACAATVHAQSDPSPYDPPPMRVGPATVTGFVQADALKVTGDDFDEAPDTFRLRRARIGLRGDFAPKLGWALSAELAGSPHVRDAFMTVRFAEQFQVRVGQFYPEYSLERMTSSSRLELIDRTRLTEALSYERNPGVMVLNAEPYRGWITYAITAFNGTGMNRSDDNDAKDATARIVITPPWIEGLAIGVNGGAGEQPDGDRDRVGADINFDRGPVRAAVEYLRETYGGVERDGFYVLGAYRIRPAQPAPHFRGAELTARFVQFDDPEGAREGTVDESVIPVRTREIQFGGNYYINRNVRFMANAIVPVDDRDVPSATFVSRLQVLF